MKIAVLLTCYNRKDKTLACLKSLSKNSSSVIVYITDDASTDGTSLAIRQYYSEEQVHIIKGTGNLFWSRGMYTAWKEALKGDFDYYLWLNDDVVLYDIFFEELLYCSNLYENNCIVTGLIEDKEHSTILYGGTSLKTHKMVQPNSEPEKVHHMNGNVVLVPCSVVKKIGIIDPYYHHDLGDVDYGLRAIENGIPVIATRVPVAYGYPNNICRVRKWGVNLRERFHRLNMPLGSPLRINYYFRKKHYGFMKAVMFCSYLTLLNLLPDWAVVKIWGTTYQNK